MCKSVFNSDKMYTFIRGYATGAKMQETLKALSFARKKHDGQLRFLLKSQGETATINSAGNAILYVVVHYGFFRMKECIHKAQDCQKRGRSF